MGMKYRFVGGEEYTTVMTFDTFGARGIVSGGNELPTAPPSTFVIHLKAKMNRVRHMF